MRLKGIAIAACMVLIATPSAKSLELQIDDLGQLTGAKGLSVGGSLLDVAFVEGTCVNLFSGCNEPSDFAFTTESEAEAAGNSLLAQVLVDGQSGDFDSESELTFGIESEAEGLIFIPFFREVDRNRVLSARVINFAFDNRVDGVNTTRLSINADTIDQQNGVFALFTPSVATVPLPAGGWLLFAALGLLGFCNRSTA